ncbi:MAG TPA: hypothetical protein VFT56_10890 [Sphingomonas sp.]|nr:hypothetical protein [Sphingomonas sp.]
MVRNPRPFRWLFAAALIVTLFMALDPKPPHLPLDDLGDKFEHSLAFATLTLLALFGFPSMLPLRIAERLSFLGALIELGQSIPVLHRDCDVRDWVADTIAILIVVLVVSTAKKAIFVQPKG